MITAVDTNVLLDVFLLDERYGHDSRERLRTAYDAGRSLYLMWCTRSRQRLSPIQRPRRRPQQNQRRYVGGLRALHE